MDYSYQVGLQESIWMSAIAMAIGLITVAVLIVKDIEGMSVEDIVSSVIALAMIGILFSGVAGLVVFCAAFTILNPLLQVEQLSLTRIPTLLSQELRNGVFGLRIASLIICFRTLAYQTDS